MPTTRDKMTKQRCRVRILSDYCKSCGLCVAVCPRGALYIADVLNSKGVRPVAFLDGAECTGCCNCAVMCPDAAIEIVFDEE